MNPNERSRIFQYPDGVPREEKNCTISTPMEKILLFVIAVLAAVMVGLSITIYKTNRANSGKTSVCFTPSCISEASNLLKSMNLSADPCEDFYSFACGNWIKQAHLETSLESQFTKLTKKILLRVKEILEDSQEQVGHQHENITKRFYKACMDKSHRNQIGARDLLTDLKKFGGWPLLTENWNPETFEWSDLMTDLFKNGYIYNMLFGVQVATDAKNTSRTLIQIVQPTLGLSKREYYILNLNNTISYRKAILDLAKLLKEDLDEQKGQMLIEQAYEIENEIAKLSKTIELRDIEKIYNIMTLTELETLAPKIPWRKILKSLLPSDTKLKDEDRIQITNPQMIEGLNAFLECMDSDRKMSLANYMFYRAVLYAAHFLNEDMSRISAEVTERDLPVTSQAWETCVKLTMDAFSHSLTSSYVRRYLDSETKILLDMMVQDLRDVLTDEIRKTEWLDSETRNYALFKVKSMKQALAYQDEAMDDQVLNNYYSYINITDDHFENIKQVGAFKSKKHLEGLHEHRKRLLWSDVTNLLTANAYYYPGQNAIIVPVGVLQDTIFAKERPNYINYGSLGMVVGHELTHAFDSIGSLYNAEGSYEMWWSKTSWQKYLERTKCFEDQYKKYYMEKAGSYVNGTLTLGENIADNGGLLTAYRAYNKLLERIGPENSLPGLPYNAKQMFWISFASVWCRKQSAESIEYAVRHNVHAPSQYRVTGPLSNIKEFSEDFKCKTKTKICSLWE